MSYNYIPMEYDSPEFDENDIMEVFYDPEMNYFVEASFGQVMCDIYRFLEPWKIMLFKQGQEDRIFSDRTNSFFVELYYPDAY